MDMEMLMVFNATERDLEAFRKLLGKVDPRLKIRNVVQPQGSFQSYIEVILGK